MGFRVIEQAGVEALLGLGFIRNVIHSDFCFHTVVIRRNHTMYCGLDVSVEVGEDVVKTAGLSACSLVCMLIIINLVVTEV